MATKSVIEIDVLDEKFQAFKKEFEKYQAALAKMPSDWNKVNASISNIEKKQKDLNKTLKDNVGQLKEAASHTASIAKNLASSVVSIGKWVALGATVSGFGLGGLAASAGTYRRTAQGYGITTGQLRAANISFGRYISPEQALSNIAEIQSDLTRRQILGRLGAQQGLNAAENLPSIIRGAVGAFKQGGQTSQYAEAMGLTQVFSMSELRRLASLNEKELNETIQEYEKARKALEVDDAKSRAWQNFWVKIQEAGNRIETSFIDKLVALAPRLEELSSKVADLVIKFVDAFGDYLATPQFEEDARKVGEALKILANATIDAAKYLGLFKDNTKPTTQDVDAQKKTLPWWGRGMAGEVAKQRLEKQNKAYQFYRSQGLSDAAAIGMVANLTQESGMYEGAINAQGNRGLMQWDKARQAEFMQVMGKSVSRASFDEQLQFSMYEFQHKEAKAYQQLRAAVSLREGVVAGLAAERPALVGTPEYAAEVERRLSIANQINVRINNATGGSAIATVNAMPGASR